MKQPQAHRRFPLLAFDRVVYEGIQLVIVKQAICPETLMKIQVLCANPSTVSDKGRCVG